MTLLGRSVLLRDFADRDYGVLYDILGRTHTYRNLGRSVRPDQFGEFIWSGVHTLKVISYKGHPDGCLGIIDLRDADLANAVAYLGILIDSVNAPDTAGGEAIALFLRHIFTTTSIRKVYAQSTKDSLPWLHDTANPIKAMRLEGLMRGHLMVGSIPKDVYTFAFWRQEVLRETEHLARFMDPDRIAIPRGHRPGPSWTEFLAELQHRFDFLPAVMPADGGGLRLVQDLHVDSFLLLEIIVWIEEHYSVTLEDEAIVHVENLQQLFTLIAPAPVPVQSSNVYVGNGR